MDPITPLPSFPPLSETLKNRPPGLGAEAEKADPEAALASLRRGAEAFESYFIASLLKEMRSSMTDSGKGGFGMGIYRSMFDEAIAREITKSGGIGLTALLTEKLSQSLKFSAQSADKGSK